MSDEVLDAISNPNELERSIGTLKYLEGAPTPETTAACDFIDTARAADAYEMLDPVTRDLFASIGIQKDKKFDPDQRMKKILADGVTIANAAARSIVWYPR